LVVFSEVMNFGLSQRGVPAVLRYLDTLKPCFPVLRVSSKLSSGSVLCNANFKRGVSSPVPFSHLEEFLEQIPSTVRYLAIFETISSAEILAWTKFLDALQREFYERGF
jgi:hypothetical protein